jgi:branched-chain amino acid transport system substrate-binding protein
MSTFGGNVWDAGLLLQQAIPQALKNGEPDSVVFLGALRKALESTTDLHASQGVINMTKTDHSGLDERARVMVQIVNGHGRLVAD